MPKRYGKQIFNAVFFLAVFALTVWAVFQGADPVQTLACLKQADPLWVFLGVVFTLAFIISESAILFYIMRTQNAKVRFSRCCLYSFVGFFYSAITPSASGGQPMQVVMMRKDGISPAVSSVVLAIVTILYKLVLVVIGVLVLLIRPDGLMVYLAPVEWLMHVGLWLNIVFIAVLLLLVFRPSIIRRLAIWTFGLIAKIRPFRDPDKQYARLERIIAQYDGTAAFYRTNPGIIVKVFFFSLLQRLFLFAVTWIIYQALGLSGTSALVIILLQAMISVAVDMLPLPGGMGISEKLFLTVFLPIFGSNMVLPCMLLTRGISYYTQLIVSGIITLLFSWDKKKK